VLIVEPAPAPQHPRPWHPKLRNRDWTGQRDKHMAKKFPETWPTLEQHLRHGWAAQDALDHVAKLLPGKPLPSTYQVKRVLREKPEAWFVVKCLSVPTNGSKRGLLVLDAQEEGIQLLTMRINLMVAEEEALRAKSPGLPVFLPEIRKTLALYFKAVQAHFETQQAMGLEPISPRRVRAHVKADDTVHHDLYSLLDADEAMKLRALDEQVNQGKLNIIEFYRAAASMLKAEQGER
jgi:hypothetical protein